MTKLSKFKLGMLDHYKSQGCKSTNLAYRGCKRSKLQTQGCKSTEVVVPANSNSYCIPSRVSQWPESPRRERTIVSTIANVLVYNNIIMGMELQSGASTPAVLSTVQGRGRRRERGREGESSFIICHYFSRTGGRCG